jgi:hypothetical protein
MLKHNIHSPLDKLKPSILKAESCISCRGKQNPGIWKAMTINCRLFFNFIQQSNDISNVLTIQNHTNTQAFQRQRQELAMGETETKFTLKYQPDISSMTPVS